QEIGLSVTDRHDSVKYGLSGWLTAVGAKVVVEPRKLYRNNNRRPDLKVQLAGKRWNVDVRVGHPLGPTNVKVAKQGAGKFLEEMESDKHRDYKDCKQAEPGAELVAFVMESTGGFGKEAVKFVQDVIKTAQRFKAVWSPKQDVYGIFRRLAIAVAK